MKTYRITFFHCLALVYILSLFACASVPSEQQTQTSKEQPSTESKVIHGVEKIQLASIDDIPTRAPLKANYDNIILRSFECNAQLQQYYPDASRACKASIISQLKSKKTYQNMTDDTNKNLPGKSVLVDMKIVDMRIASGAARFWGGAFAGNSFMDVLLELRDSDSEKVVHQKVLSTSNNAVAAAWSFGASDRTLPSDLGTFIGEYIFRIVSGTK
jgi:hypothetical protein